MVEIFLLEHLPISPLTSPRAIVTSGMETQKPLEESESLDLPLDRFEGSLPINSPMSSLGQRKSINWARPLAPSMQILKCVKRSSTRLSGKSCPGTVNPSSGSIDGDKNFKEAVQSSEDERPIGVVSFGTRRRGRPCKLSQTLAASPGPEPQEESKHSSTQEGAASMSYLHKNARAIQRGSESDQLDDNIDMQVAAAQRRWASVPLDGKEGNSNAAYKSAQDYVYNSEAVNKFCLKSSDVDEAIARKSTGVGYCSEVAVCGFNTQSAWQENPELSCKKASELEFKLHEKSTNEKLWLQSLAGVKEAIHNFEQRTLELLEDQLKAFRKEETRIADLAVLQEERLRKEIFELMQTNSRILKEKAAIEHQSDFLQTGFLKTLETTRESLRLEMGREHTKIVAVLTKELGEERDKRMCQICFHKPRDAIVLPCMHFEYCSGCLRDQKGCPTCRAKINGVLHCNLCTS